jgi:hypothetical protein
MRYDPPTSPLCKTITCDEGAHSVACCFLTSSSKFSRVTRTKRKSDKNIFTAKSIVSAFFLSRSTSQGGWERQSRYVRLGSEPY